MDHNAKAKTLIGITTYQRTDALKTELESLLTHGYLEGNAVHIADDGGGLPYERHGFLYKSAKEIVDEYKDRVDISMAYGPQRTGVSKNKNRNIDYFLNHPEFDRLLLLDDDLEFIRPGLLEEFEAARDNELKTSGVDKGRHITTFIHVPEWLAAHPPYAENDYMWWRQVSQGIGLWFTRDVVEGIGYWNPTAPWNYGYDHDEYSSRASRWQGYSPDMRPMLKRSARFFRTNDVPRNYDPGTQAQIDKNWPWFQDRIKETREGRELFCQKSGLKKEKERFYG